jgi:hypothetical protein
VPVLGVGKVQAHSQNGRVPSLGSAFSSVLEHRTQKRVPAAYARGHCAGVSVDDAGLSALGAAADIGETDDAWLAQEMIMPGQRSRTPFNRRACAHGAAPHGVRSDRRVSASSGDRID